MLDRYEVVNKMRERGFTEYANIGKTKIQFISAHMYDFNYEEKTPRHKRMPIINVIVDLEKNEFSGIYNVDKSTNTLNTSTCSPVMNDEHFDRIIGTFEMQAKWLERLRD